MLTKLAECFSTWQVSRIKRKYTRGVKITDFDEKIFYFAKTIIESRKSRDCYRRAKRYHRRASLSNDSFSEAYYLLGNSFLEEGNKHLRKAKAANKLS